MESQAARSGDAILSFPAVILTFSSCVLPSDSLTQIPAKVNKTGRPCTSETTEHYSKLLRVCRFSWHNK